MKKILKIGKAILNILTTICIVIGILFVVLFFLGIQPYVVVSGSMEPEIKTGSVCFINKNAKYEEVRIGDVIAFKIKSGEYATHRVCNISEEGITTKGDANRVEDDIITTRDNFIGKNIFSIPNAGVVITVIQSPSGKIILGTIILVLFVAAVLVGTPGKNKKSKD